MEWVKGLFGGEGYERPEECVKMNNIIWARMGMIECIVGSGYRQKPLSRLVLNWNIKRLMKEKKKGQGKYSQLLKEVKYLYFKMGQVIVIGKDVRG